MKEQAKPQIGNTIHDPVPFFTKGGKQESSNMNPVPFFSLAGIQPKLEISQPGDEYEQQADRMADQVMTMPDKKVQRKSPWNEDEEDPIQMKPISGENTTLVQRKSPWNEDEEDPIQMERISRYEKDPWDERVQKKQEAGRQQESGGPDMALFRDQLQGTKGSGNPLPAGTKQTMEHNFGTDFSQVKVHTHPEAVRLSKDINAKAFTHGSDIYFGGGYYNPESTSGKHLLAHELTHVVQQGNSPITLQKEDETNRTGGGASFSSPVLDETLNQTRAVQGAISGRRLRETERILAFNIFGNSIDYSNVRLILTNVAPGTTAGNNIALPPNFNISNNEHKQLLIHEMTHVWQYQHFGPGYISSSLFLQARAAIARGNRNFAYSYTINPDNTFFNFGPEQQAFIVENYYAMLRDQQSLSRPEGNALTYHSNHMDANGFPAVITAERRRSEIAEEMPLHAPLIRQMASTPFLLPAQHMEARQRNLMIMPPQNGEEQSNRELGFTPTAALLTIRFGSRGRRR